MNYLSRATGCGKRDRGGLSLHFVWELQSRSITYVLKQSACQVACQNHTGKPWVRRNLAKYLAACITFDCLIIRLRLPLYLPPFLPPAPPPPTLSPALARIAPGAITRGREKSISCG